MNNLWRIVVVFISSITLIACLTPKNTEPLEVGISPWPGYDIIYYAADKKLFEKNGLEVTFHRFDNTEDSMRALRRGQLDIAFSTIWETMHVRSDDDMPSAILVADISSGSDGIVARKGINSVKDLAGKKVSAKIGTVAHLILIEALLKHDQTATQVELIDVSNSEGSRLLSEGKIDAAVMWQPDLSDTQKAIDGHIIHTTADLESLVVDILLMAPNITEDKIPQVQKFVDTWFEVQTHIKTKPNEVFSAVGNLLHQSAQSYQSDYQGLKPGDIELNRKYITEGELKRSIEKIEASMDKDTYQLNPNINVEPRFVKAI